MTHQKKKIEMNREKNIFQSRGYISNVCVRVHACVHVCVGACVCGCVGVCVRSRVRN